VGSREFDPLKLAVPALELEEVAPATEVAGVELAAPEEMLEPNNKDSLGLEASKSRKKAARKGRGQEKAKRQPEKYAHGVKVIKAEDYGKKKEVKPSAALKT